MKPIIKKTFAAGIMLLLSYVAVAQKDSSYFDRFLSRFIQSYAVLAKPPVKNAYRLLSNTADYMFKEIDPLFSKTVIEVSAKEKVNEKEAVAIMFQRVFNVLDSGTLWIDARDIFSQDKDFMALYNDAICPCISRKVKKDDLGEVYVKAIETCSFEMLKDTVLINKVHQLDGNKKMNDIFRLQQYLSLYLYQHCPLINNYYRKTILGYPVGENYLTAVETRLQHQAANALKYYQNNQRDSLLAIFPNYKKYDAVLKNIMSYLKQPGVIQKEYVSQTQAGVKTNASVTLNCEKGKSGTVIFVTTYSSLQSVFSSVQFEKYDPTKEIKEDIIIKPVENTPQ